MTERKLNTMKKFDIIVKINTIILCFAAICCGAGWAIGSFLFVYTSTIGFIDGVRNKNFHGIVINSAFLALNLFNSIKTILGWF
jgi:hypothetical protein